jgi:molybdate transport system permease protein
MKPLPRTWFTNRWQLLTIPLVAFLVLPLLVLYMSTSPASLVASLGKQAVRQAILVSLGTTAVATALIVVLGTPVALYLARCCQTPWRRLLDVLVDLPTVLPPAVAGLALLLTFGRRGVLGALLEPLGIQLAFTPAAVVMAQVFVAAPLFVRSAAIGFATIDPEMEQAAALDGANGRQILRFVVLPLAWPALLSGSVMSWARALGEFGATMIFAGNFPGRTQTMPLAIYLGFELDLDMALTLSVILVSCSVVVLMLARRLAREE